MKLDSSPRWLNLFGSAPRKGAPGAMDAKKEGTYSSGFPKNRPRVYLPPLGGESCVPRK